MTEICVSLELNRMDSLSNKIQNFCQPYFFTATGSILGRTTSSSTFFSFFRAAVVVEPMKLKKRIAAGINWRRTMMAPMIKKIQRAVPAPFNSMDLANAGEAKSVIAAPITPIFKLCLFPNMANSPFLFIWGFWLTSPYISAYLMPISEGGREKL